MAFKADVYQLAFTSAVTGNTFSSAISLNGSYAYMYLQIPTMSVGYSNANTPIWIQASADNATFARITNIETTAATLVAGIDDFVVASSVSSRMVFVPFPGVPYVKLEVSGTCTNPTAISNANIFKLICISNT